MSLTPRLTMIGMYNFDNTLFNSAVFPEGVNKELFVNSLLVKFGECPVIYPNIPFFKNAVNVWSLKWYDSIARLVNTFNAEYNPIYNYDRTETEEIDETVNDEGTGRVTETNTGTKGETRTGDETITYNVTDEETGTTTTDRTTETQTTINESTENTVSAYNSPTYAPSTKTVKTGTDTETTQENITSEMESEKTKTGTEEKEFSESLTGNESNSRNVNQNNSNEKERDFNRTLRAYGNIGVTTSQQMFKEEMEIRKNVNLYDVLSEMFYREFCIYVY